MSGAPDRPAPPTAARSSQPSASPGKPRTSTVTPIEPALEVASARDLAWDDEADVLVVGWGAAGACAALEARAAGASVLVLDRFGGGGASVLSGGVVYAGGGTPYQQQAGYDDSPQAMFEYLRHETQGVVSDETLLRFCQQSVGNLAWLALAQLPGQLFKAGRIELQPFHQGALALGSGIGSGQQQV